MAEGENSKHIPKQVPPLEVEDILPTLRKEALDNDREALYTPGEVAEIGAAINVRNFKRKVKEIVNRGK